MKIFDNSLETLIIKYTIGTAFIVITVGFGMKILILLSTVAKVKMALALEGLREHMWLYEFLKGLAERGSVK